MIGSAILKPSIQPGWGQVSADSMMLGRTMLTGTAGRPGASFDVPDVSSSTTRSPIALVNV